MPSVEWMRSWNTDGKFCCSKALVSAEALRDTQNQLKWRGVTFSHVKETTFPLSTLFEN